MLGAAVIYRTWGSRFAVIPANAGIHSLNGASLAGCEVDSRFRGNDRRIEWLHHSNDIITPARLPQELDFHSCEG